MDAYITPTRYRALGTGVDLTGVDDSELQARLLSASMAVNSFVNAPDGYSFLGGTVTDEEHLWPTTPPRAPKRQTGRIWVYNRPLREATGIRINVTREQHIDFEDDQVFVARDMGYIEPVAAPNTTALLTSVPPWLLTSPMAYVSYTYGWDIPVIDETMATLSGGILQGNQQYWLTDEDVILKKNGVVVPEVDYTVDYIEGRITPDTAPTNELWQASYHTRIPPGVAAATALITSDISGSVALAAGGLLGLSGIKVEEVELRQSSKVNYYVQPVNAAAQSYLAPYRAMFMSMR